MDDQTKTAKLIGGLAGALNGLIETGDGLDNLLYSINSKRSRGHSWPTAEELDSIKVFGDSPIERGSWQEIYTDVKRAAVWWWQSWDDANLMLADVPRQVIDDQTAPLEQRLSAQITKPLNGVPAAIARTRPDGDAILWQWFGHYGNMDDWQENRALLADCVDRLRCVQGALPVPAVPIVGNLLADIAKVESIAAELALHGLSGIAKADIGTILGRGESALHASISGNSIDGATGQRVRDILALLGKAYAGNLDPQTAAAQLRDRCEFIRGGWVLIGAGDLGKPLVKLTHILYRLLDAGDDLANADYLLALDNASGSDLAARQAEDRRQAYGRFKAAAEQAAPVLPAELAEQLRRYAHDASGIAGPVDTQAWTALKVALQRATATRPAVPAVEVVGDAQGDGGGNSGDDEKQSGGKQVEAAQGGGAAEVGAEQATFRLLGVFSGGISDDRIAKAAGILHSKKMVANEKLTSINAILPFPPTASAKQLADLLGVTKTAIQKTAWWIENRKGERDNLIGRRHAKHQERAKEYEADNRD